MPVRDDTLYRIYSMTKPITSVALMMLFEEGHFLLENAVSRWIPEFADVRVSVGGTADAPETVPLEAPLTVRHVLTHTSGLTYGFHYAHPVDELYRRAELGDSSRRPATTSTAAWSSWLHSHSSSNPAHGGSTRCRPTCAARWSNA